MSPNEETPKPLLQAIRVRGCYKRLGGDKTSQNIIFLDEVSFVVVTRAEKARLKRTVCLHPCTR